MSRVWTIDELSRMAGERWAREDAEKLERVQAGENRPGRREPRRARPGHGAKKSRRYAPTSLGGENS